MNPIIRPYQPSDFEAVVDVWHRAGLAAYPYLPTWQAFTREHAGRVFAEVILAHNDLWVGEQDGRIVAYMAINAGYIDRLYVDPPAWHQGWGTRFIEFAKRLSPAGLELVTHQQNLAARALYEKHGFVAVRFGVSPPPESAPDVTYQWQP